MSGGQDDGQEKTAEPTPERLRKAREDGDVAKSNDVSAAAAYIGLLVALSVVVSSSAANIGEALSSFFATPELIRERVFAPAGEQVLAGMLFHAVTASLPVMALPLIFVLVSLLAQQAFVFAPKKLQMKGSRLSLIENAKQKYGWTGLVEFLKSMVKLILIALVLALIVSQGLDRFVAMVHLSGKALPGILRDEATRLLIATTVVASAIAVADYFWRSFDHRRKLRMSHEELKKEAKESEGDPYMKQSRQMRAREIATNRMMSDVPKADVVIVNPTHYAVAFQWERTPGSAPFCVAKGVDNIALRIREVAEEADVPIFSDPPTARALYAEIEIGQEIEPQHYAAVATAIRFSDEMRRKARGLQGQGGRMDRTALARLIDVKEAIRISKMQECTQLLAHIRAVDARIEAEGKGKGFEVSSGADFIFAAKAAEAGRRNLRNFQAARAELQAKLEIAQLEAAEAKAHLRALNRMLNGEDG